jgi:hypothetical protein
MVTYLAAPLTLRRNISNDNTATNRNNRGDQTTAVAPYSASQKLHSTVVDSPLCARVPSLHLHWSSIAYRGNNDDVMHAWRGEVG